MLGGRESARARAYATSAGARTRACTQARARGREHACVRAPAISARAPADAGADRINGRVLLAASRLDSRETGRSTHLEQSWQ